MFDPDVPPMVVGRPSATPPGNRQSARQCHQIYRSWRSGIARRSETRAERRHFGSFRHEDTGIGISEDKRKVIFEAFTQADTSASRKYSGTGLGLTISSRLVEMMGVRFGWIANWGMEARFTSRLVSICRRE